MAGEQRGRVLKKEISMDKRVSQLKTAWSKLLYTWCVPHLDSMGRMQGDPEIVRGHILPREKAATEGKIAEWLQDIHSCGLLFWYKVSNEMFLQCPTAEKNLFHRQDRERSTEIPPPDQKDYEKWLKEVRNTCQDVTGHGKTCLLGSRSRREVEGKEKHHDFVLLTKEEYGKLVDKLGKDLTEDYIQRLDDYIGSKRVRYVSHYHTILVWYRKNDQEGGKSNVQPNISASQRAQLETDAQSGHKV